VAIYLTCFRRVIVRALLIVLAVLPIFVHAQTFPSGVVEASEEAARRELQRQQERERALRERLEERPDVRFERTADGLERLPLEETPCFIINEITLEGDSADQFMFALSAASPSEDPAFGRCLGTQSINIMMKRIQNRIIAKGFITTRILAAPQDLSSGVLTLTVIPGRVREVRFSDSTPNRATKWNAIPVSPGDILNLRDVEQALEVFKRLPTAEADFKVVPAEGEGARPGESDVIIEWNQGKPVRFNLSIDDSGSKHTGRVQGNATLSLDHTFLLNDLFYINYGRDLGGGADNAKGTESYVIHYEIPYKYWTLAYTTSKNTYYQTIPGIGENYIYSGKSTNHSLKLSRLFYRDAARKSTAWFSGWNRMSSNYINDAEIELQRRNMAGWEFGLNHKEFISAATLDTTVSYKRGTGMLGARAAPEEPFGEGTSRPEKILANLFFNVPFSLFDQRLSYSLNYRGQWNHTPLVPQDRFSIGGRYTVRGFDGEMTLMGDRGWLVRNDLGIALGNTGQQFYLGVDYGEVNGQSTQYLSGKHLAGATIGIKGGYKGFYWDFFAGTPLSKPEGFKTLNIAAGFNIGWAY
jgi:hemolysin activation/secretion protein